VECTTAGTGDFPPLPREATDAGEFTGSHHPAMQIIWGVLEPKNLVDVKGFERSTPCLQRKLGSQLASHSEAPDWSDPRRRGPGESPRPSPEENLRASDGRSGLDCIRRYLGPPRLVLVLSGVLHSVLIHRYK